jgi:hypothetical protein
MNTHVDRMEEDAPPTGSIWEHEKSGHTYVVLGLCRIEATNTPAVLYTQAGADGDAITWARPVAQFLDGRFKPLTPS